MTAARMKKAARISLAGMALLALAACAPGRDRYGDPREGYLLDPWQWEVLADWSAVKTIGVVLTEFKFLPDGLVFEQGVPYRLRLENMGDYTHFFAAEEFFKSIAVRSLVSSEETVSHPLLEEIAVPSGAVRELTFVPVRVGVYELDCTVLGHAFFGMTGTIEIVGES